MRIGLSNKITVVLLIVLLIPSSICANKLIYGLAGGGSVLVGDVKDYWNGGLGLGANLFFRVRPDLYVGGRFSYTRWASVPYAGWIGDKFISYGDAWTVEVVPSLRYAFSLNDENPVNFFVQAGFGYGYLGSEYRETNIYAHDGYMPASDSKIKRIDSQHRPVFDIGFGMMSTGLGSVHFELIPMFSYLLSNEVPFTSLSLHAAVGFNR